MAPNHITAQNAPSATAAAMWAETSRMRVSEGWHACPTVGVYTMGIISSRFSNSTR